MAEPQGGGAEGSRRRSTSAARRGAAAPTQEGATPPSPSSPCGACKFLRRKCVAGCIFAPHFSSDQGAAKFAAVHKVFGASNVSKLLLHVPAHRRNEAVATICYEAQARLSDPVYGCVSTILSLQQQVASLQAEVAMTQTQVMNGRIAYASVLDTTQQQQQQQQQQALQHHHPNMINTLGLYPAFSNSSSASTTNLMNITNFNPATGGFDLSMEAATAPSSSHSIHPLHHNSNFSRLSQYDDDDEQESKIPPVFNPDL
ncbi:LOB domain-containing protein 20-like [Arachis stenosperma]|uniref:LOB domain-containing protein 20-like n=1 Tax=Arachis stenosperma TaxID=217475 RepID=UPI0025ABD7A6|nr:LOB domain-containing protein 20-like [Arachis stenosperma]